MDGDKRTSSLDDGASGAGHSADTGSATVRFRAVDTGSVLGRYELGEELGSGGMATVYRARDTELRRDVAIKVLFPHLSKRRDVVARFHREARAAAALDHPGIVRVYDTGGGAPASEAADGPRLADPPYLVMELIEGRSLAEVIAEHKPFLAEVVACVGALLCSALAEAHRAGIIHRDIKPSNVMVTARGRVALTDFGVARIEGDDASALTRSGMLLGTPAFMSPEQAMSDPLDERSDIYSLGATLYQLATGSQPYAGSTARVMAAIAEHSLVPPLQRNPAMGTELARIIERMMAREPAQRYQRASQAAADLRTMVGYIGIDAAPEAMTRALARFFTDPGAHDQAMVPVVVRATLRRAREAAEQRALPRAMALADRALALDESCHEALALVERLGVDRSRRRRLVVVSALALAAVASVAVAGNWHRMAGHASTSPALDAGPDDAAMAPLSGARGNGVGAAPAIPAPRAAPAGVRTGLATLAGAPSGAEATSAARPHSDTRPTGAGPAADTPEPDTRPAEISLPARSGSGRRGQAGGVSRSSRQPPPEQPPGPLASRRRSERRGQDPGAEQSVHPVVPADAGPAPRLGAARPDAAPARATLSVDIKPWCDLTVDGTDHGRASRDRIITLPPGRHELVCSQGPGRPAWRRTVRLAAGEHQHLTGSVLQPVRVRIGVTRGSAVRIGNRRHDNGAALSLEPGRYRIAVLAGGREVEYDWVSIPAVRACTVRDLPALDCYR